MVYMNPHFRRVSLDLPIAQVSRPFKKREECDVCKWFVASIFCSSFELAVRRNFKKKETDSACFDWQKFMFTRHYSDYSYDQ